MEQKNASHPVTLKERGDFWKRFCDSPATFALGDAIQTWYKENYDKVILSETSFFCNKHETTDNSDEVFRSFRDAISPYVKVK